MEAYRDFRDVLAEQIRVSFPELREQVDEVIEGTGGVGGRGGNGESADGGEGAGKDGGVDLEDQDGES